MRHLSYHKIYDIILLVCVTIFAAHGASADEPRCSACHASMMDEPMMLPDSPPADILRGFTSPCFHYASVLEEWYSVEELFATIEHHLFILEEDRYHVEPLYEQMVDSRNFYREMLNAPVISLADFKIKTGKLRFDLGKIYRTVKEKRVEQRSRDLFGIIVLGTLFLMFIFVTGWRIAAGKGVVHPRETTLGYDTLQEQAEAKEKEVSA